MKPTPAGHYCSSSGSAGDLRIEASKKLAKLYDSLIKANPDWATDERRHDMNQLVMRLIFCMFAQKVGIFPDEQFSRLIFTHAGDRGEEMQATLIAAFRAMNLPKDKREELPFWTAELEYVNGGLFAGTIDAPRCDVLAFRYLKRIAELVKQAKAGHGADYPASIKSAGQKALFDNLNSDEELALRIDQAVRNVAPDGWRGHMMKEKKVRRAIEVGLLGDEALVDSIMAILKNHSEY